MGIEMQQTSEAKRAQHTPTEFHLSFFGPSKSEYVEWPAGSVSVYAIGGDEIADRIGRNAQGQIVRRDSWCGFLGCFRSLDEAMAAIAKARGEA